MADTWSRRASGYRPLCLCGQPTLDVMRGICRRLVGSPPALTCEGVGGVPARPVMFRSGRFVLAMVFLGFLQELGQRREVEAESSAGKPSLDLLQQPAVAVWVGK